MQEMWVLSRSGKSPEGGYGNPLQCSCLGKFHRQKGLVSYSPWGHEELDITDLARTCTRAERIRLVWDTHPLFQAHPQGRREPSQRLSGLVRPSQAWFYLHREEEGFRTSGNLLPQQIKWFTITVTQARPRLAKDRGRASDIRRL